MSRGAKLGWVLVPASAAYFAFQLGFHLGQFPAPHGDEAWSGLYAMRIGANGVSSPHAMNVLTSPLYGWLVSGLFHLNGAGIAALRTPGVVANVLAVALVVAHFLRRARIPAASGWILLLTASAFFLIKSRVAWEVYALQNLLLAVLFVLLASFVEDGKYGFWRALVFIVVNEIGVLNHFIFLSVPLSLTVLLVVLLARERDWSLLPLFRLVTLTTSSAVLMMGVKVIVSDQIWQAHRAWLLLVLIAALLAGAAMCAGPSVRWDGWIRARVEGIAAQQALFRVLGYLLAAGLALFGVLHLVALVQVIAGVVIFERAMSWAPPVWLSIPLYLWAASLVGWYAVDAERIWRGASRVSSYEKVLALWPLAYMAIFTSVRFTANIRHYHLLFFLLTTALAFSLPRMNVAVRRSGVACTAVVALLVQLVVWREIMSPQERRPIRLRLGWTSDVSEHFTRLEPLYDVISRERVCRLDVPDFFLRTPLEFYIATHETPCDESRRLTADYCQSCEAPPYVRWMVVEQN